MRIAVNPDYQGVRTGSLPHSVIPAFGSRAHTDFQPVCQMGYGSRALQLLQMYYEGKFPTMDESTGSNPNEITSVSSEVIQSDTSFSSGNDQIQRAFDGRRPRWALL